MQKLSKLIKLSDSLTLTGLCSLGYGLYLYSPALAFSVIGALVLIGGVLLSLNEDKTETES